MKCTPIILFIAVLSLLPTLSCQAQLTAAVRTPVRVMNTKIGSASCEPVSYHTGNMNDAVTQTHFGLVLMGGGTDVDNAFKWMIQRSGGGDFVILRASGADGYNDYLYRQLGGVNSVESLVVDSREKANCLSVAAKIKKAEALFIAGGDQSDYYKYWKNTSVQEAIEFLVQQKQAPIGGTSAGMAIMGELAYTAENGSVTSSDALKNPYDPEITLKKDFLSLPLMQGIVTDTHFSPRERQGRLLTFMAQAIQNKMVPQALALKGIGMDENTAAVVDESGNAHIFGSASAWFFKALHGAAEICIPNTPLTWNRNHQAVNVIQIKGTEHATNIFNIRDWKLLVGEQLPFYYYIENGHLHTH